MSWLGLSAASWVRTARVTAAAVADGSPGEPGNGTQVAGVDHQFGDAGGEVVDERDDARRVREVGAVGGGCYDALGVGRHLCDATHDVRIEFGSAVSRSFGDVGVDIRGTEGSAEVGGGGVESCGVVGVAVEEVFDVGERSRGVGDELHDGPAAVRRPVEVSRPDLRDHVYEVVGSIDERCTHR